MTAMTQNQIVFDYYERYKTDVPRSRLLWVGSDGMPTGDIVPYMLLDFAMITPTASTTYVGLLNDGYFIMTDIPSGISNMTHNILIIGYEDDEFIYYDPADGTQKKISPSGIAGNYFGITKDKK